MDSMLGVLFAALFALAGVGTILTVQQRGADNQRAAATAGQLKQISAAAQAYTQANGAAIEAVATASSPAIITIPMLQATQFLAAGISATNPYGQTWQVQVLQPTAGVLQTLVLSLGGTVIPTQLAPQIAALTGAQGGFIPAAGQYGSLTSDVAQGAYGGWQVPLAGYTKPGAGHLAALVQFNNGNPTNDYLYRVAVPGQPQLNTMQTTLNMGTNSIVNANNVEAQTATLAAGTPNGQLGALQIGAAYYFGDDTNSAVRQPGGLFVQHYDFSPADISVGNSTVNGTQLVTSASVIQGTQEVQLDQTLDGNSFVLGQQMVQGNQRVFGSQGVKGDSMVSGSSTIQGSQTIFQNLSVNGTSTLNGPVQMETGAEVDGALNVVGSEAVSVNLSVAAGTYTNSLQVNTNTLVGGALTFTGAAGAASGGIFCGNGTATGTGSIAYDFSKGSLAYCGNDQVWHDLVAAN